MPTHPQSEGVIEKPAKEISELPFELPPIPPPTEPFRGVESFRFCDQSIFSERLDEAFRLQKMVFVYRAMLLAGGSGVGKSSLVNAGFLPAILKERFLPERVRVRPTPGAEFQAERIPLGEADQPPYLPSRFIAVSRSEGSEAVSAEQFAEIVSAEHRAGPALLVFDQFEELVTLFDETSDSPEKYKEAQIAQLSIIRTLARLLQEPKLPVKFLFVFRDDYYLKLSRFFDRVPGLREQGMYLEPLPSTKLKHLIREPFVMAAKAGKAFERTIEDPLADEIATAIATYSDSPYVNLTEIQIICQTLWRDPHGAENFVAAADKVQQIKTLLGRYIDERIGRLSDQLREPAIGILIRLLTASDTRNIVAEPDLVERLEQEDGIPRQVSIEALNKLVTESRLVNRQRRGVTAFYDIVSEFLIPWIRRRRDTHRNKLREDRRIKELLQKEKTRRIIWITMLGATAVVTFSMLLFVKERNAVQRKHLLMARAQSVAVVAKRGGPYPAMLATIDGITSCLREKAYAPEDAVITMRNATEGVVSELKLPNSKTQSNGKPLKGNRAEFIPAVSSPDESAIITVEDGTTPILWDTWTFKPTRLTSVNGSISAVGFSLNSKKLAVATRETVYGWDIPDRVKDVSVAWNTKGSDILEALLSGSNKHSKVARALQENAIKRIPPTTGTWGNYVELTNAWLGEAIGLIIRKYSPDERLSFPKLSSGTADRIFTDEANTARELARNNPEAAKEQFTETLRDFRLEKIDAGMTLAQMYVSSARQLSVERAYRRAADDYDHAQVLDPKLNLNKIAQALRTLQDAYDSTAKGNFSDAEKYYRSAQLLDKSLVDAHAPNFLAEVQAQAQSQDPEEASQLANESKEFERMNDLLRRANELAITGDGAEAKKLYEEAKTLFPTTLEKLDADDEIRKLSPKVPSQDATPPQTGAAPTPSR